MNLVSCTFLFRATLADEVIFLIALCVFLDIIVILRRKRETNGRKCVILFLPPPLQRIVVSVGFDVCGVDKLLKRGACRVIGGPLLLYGNK